MPPFFNYSYTRFDYNSSIYGIEWTVKYPMIQPDGSVIDTKTSITRIQEWVELPYLAGGWKCRTLRLDDNPPTSTLFSIKCHLKINDFIEVNNMLRCTDIQMKKDKKIYKDNKENKLALHLTEPNGMTSIYIECKL